MANGRFLTTIVGKAGSGKSHLIKEILPSLPRPVLMLDTLNEYADGLQFATAMELRDYLVSGRPNASGIYILNATTDADCELFFRILTVSKAPMSVVVDETDLFCTSHSIWDDLQRSIRYGRHWRQNLVCAARRCADLNNAIVSQSDAIISFKQTLPRDIATLKKSYPEADRLADLDSDRYEFLALGEWEDLPFAHVLRNMPIANDAAV